MARGDFKRCRNPACQKTIRQALVGKEKFYCNLTCKNAHYHIMHRKFTANEILNLSGLPRVERTRPMAWQHIGAEDFIRRANRLLAYISETDNIPATF